MSPTAHGGFPETRWSRVMRAWNRADESAARLAMEEFCHLYWYPLYGHARRRGWSPEDAQDRTQDFFRALVRDDLLRQLRPGGGRLRTFLLHAFERDLIDARRAARRLKRGGGTEPWTLDLAVAEERFALEARPGSDPGVEYDRDWAVSLLEASLATLADSYARMGKADAFRVLRRFLDPRESEPRTYEAVSAELGLEPAALRQSVRRLRHRFRIALRTRIAETLESADAAAVEAEWLVLKDALMWEG